MGSGSKNCYFQFSHRYMIRFYMSFHTVQQFCCYFKWFSRKLRLTFSPIIVCKLFKSELMDNACIVNQIWLLDLLQIWFKIEENLEFWKFHSSFVINLRLTFIFNYKQWLWHGKFNFNEYVLRNVCIKIRFIEKMAN